MMRVPLLLLAGIEVELAYIILFLVKTLQVSP